MRKLLLAAWMAFTTLHAGGMMEVFATRIDSNTTHTVADGDVLVIFEDQYLSANTLRYERNSTTLELMGNITVMKGALYHGVGEYARINLHARDREFRPFYLVDKKMDVWMSTERGCEQGNMVTLGRGMVSSCDPNKPLWKIYYSGSDYNTDTKWMNIYHARLHLYDIPVFYLPYFGYSLDTRRRTGLLIPSFGISSSEGLYYRQPLYVTMSDQWDLELRPQIRTKRGHALYGNFRFVDSPVSSGEIRTGLFQEKRDYIRDNNLANSQHYGFNLHYENSAFLQRWFDIGHNGQSGLYSDITWMNDIDYLNLSDNDETKNATSNQIFSRLNLFYNEADHYVGAYFKYFLDLSQNNNDQTIQSLPIMQYHRYLRSFLDDHFYYSVNANVNNFYRDAGVNAMQSELDIPLTLRTSLFDDYLDVSYRMQLYGRHISFSGSEVQPDPYHRYDSGLFAQNYHTVNIETSLIRGYENVSHTITLGANYTKGGSEYLSGYYEDSEAICSYRYVSDNPLCDYYTIQNIAEASQFTFSQFFVDHDGNQLLYHKLAQDVTHNSNQEQFGELESELELRLNGSLMFYNDTLYNHDRKRVTKFLNALRYNGETISANLTHLYEDVLKESNPVYSTYMTADVVYRYDDHYQYFTRLAYDFQAHLKKRIEVGFLYSKRCWDFGIRYVENNRPVLTREDASSIYDKYIYFTIVLKPIGGTDLNYKIDNVLEGS